MKTNFLKSTLMSMSLFVAVTMTVSCSKEADELALKTTDTEQSSMDGSVDGSLEKVVADKSLTSMAIPNLVLHVAGTTPRSFAISPRILYNTSGTSSTLVGIFPTTLPAGSTETQAKFLLGATWSTYLKPSSNVAYIIEKPYQSGCHQGLRVVFQNNINPSAANTTAHVTYNPIGDTYTVTHQGKNVSISTVTVGCTPN